MVESADMDEPLEPGQSVKVRPYSFRTDAIAYYTGVVVPVIEQRAAEVLVRMPNGMTVMLSRKEVVPV